MTSLFTPFQKFLITWLLILVTGWLTVKTISYLGGLVSILIAAGLVAFLLNYPVKALRKLFPRSLAAVLVYLGTGFIVLFLVFILLPPVVTQGRQLITRLPELLDTGQQQLDSFQLWSLERKLPYNVDVQFLVSQILERIEAKAEAIASTGFDIVIDTFNTLLNIILILVISFYFLLDGERLWQNLINIFAPPLQRELTVSIERNLQGFVTGQLILGLFMTTTLSLGFWLLKVPFFLLFAVFIGFMEIIPFIGATLGIVTVVVIVAIINGLLALQVLAIAIALQQIKDNLIAPRIMGNLTGVSPAVIFISLLLGAKIAGFLGVILAIPLTGVANSLADVINDPDLPPQTGSFFQNPLKGKASAPNKQKG